MMHMNKNATIADIQSALLDGEDVMIKGFGSFRIADVGERHNRNPRTGEPVISPAHKTARFKLSPMMKDAING